MVKKPKLDNKLAILRQFSSQIVLAVLVIVILIAVYGAYQEEAKKTEALPLSDLVRKISAGEVVSITVSGSNLDIVDKDTKHYSAKKEAESSLSQTLINYGVKPEALDKLSLKIQSDTGSSFWLMTFLPIVAPIIFILIFFWYLSRQVKGAGVQALSFGQSKARIIYPDDSGQKVTFADVAGVKEAKEELTEIVDFLRNPKKFLEIGARIPKGVLLMGAPGTGKTLLARAVAGEAKVPFLYLSGSEFVEMFVGVGASRVRDLFNLAKNAAPAIIFIDEIDAIGRHRGSGMGGGNDEREQTLNQILVEMDGFEPNEKLIVMAATNRPDVLDPALLRPGRFDRRVVLDSPDLKDREAIMTLHAKKKPLGPDVNFRVIAERTPGFSGADLANAMNEGAILAARESRKEISQYDLIRSVEKVMLGPERKSHILSAKEKRITAYHEIGHALTASVLEYADPVHKVSIVSRGHAAGYTLKLPFEDRKLQTRKEFIDDLVVSMGGYAAEQLVFNDVTTGASNDIQVATALARAMVTKYGMSEKLGPVALDNQTKMTMLGPLSDGGISESMSAQIDAEVSNLIKVASAEATKIIIDHRQALDQMSAELFRVETLEREEFDKLLVLNGLKPKVQKEDEGWKIL
ncbi:MAG: cell division protein FtsH [Candidatus Vogelbacteria bacterium CG22_combo_CG10-13_8_21_14_all_37_9]|uniref:ATP-dependent zinc metalloprotease FtsH n=1 Tax=Candidatus Vogelbacteria bacterium CG22_combo_CG10-13_8_21_14_all_37_9 TaxID=1975046 RepID=A0A2H0BKB4_9BACT|nr:MAG: cell division protein FtsH [bacterium CG10_37_50]PIP58102.1 MAG: cell division protein FtsH [Candidatus Vogelbacteria bacterium CG22_combo_CG10-13_8_21_14_all_37_9]